MTSHHRNESAPGTALQTLGTQEPDALGFETIQSEQTFAPGFYWTCTEGCGEIPAGETLLLLDVNEFEGNPHSVKLRCHPRDGEGYHVVMVADFMASFVPCRNADEIRQREQQAVMQEVTDLQNELVRVQMDPQLMIAAVREDVEKAIKAAEAKEEQPNRSDVEKAEERSRNIGKTHRRAARRSAAAGNPLTTPRAALASDIGDLISAGINEAGLAEMSKLAGRQAIVAGAQAGWLQKKTDAISASLTKLAPYISERSAVALARASGAVKMSERIRRGIASLDLYTGKGVDAFDIRTGAAAPTSEPLTILQGKRYAEEELAVWADVTDEFDFRDKQRFFDAIASSDELMQQILPTPRCAVSVAMTRHSRDYGDAAANLLYNIQNALVFLLVRNGQNVHVVYSGSPSHEGATRLFPTTDELNRPFAGVDGARISIRDTEFADASKRFDDLALVYRRFLILLCGLDHRLQLFGEFYPPELSMSFMTAEFQASYMRFLSDDEGSGLLLGDSLPTLESWMAGHNKMVQSGSRVFVLNNSSAIKEHAPEIKRRHELKPAKAQFARPFIAQREGARFFVSLETTGDVQQARCWLSDEENSAHGSAWWLCVDDVAIEDVRRYRHSRTYRSMGIAYLRLFRRLESYLEVERAVESESRAYLVKQATEHGGLTLELAQSALDGAVRNYRAARRGAALPGIDDLAELNKVLNLMVPEGHISAPVEAMLATYLETTGSKPLLLTRTGKAKLVLYVEASDADRAPYPDVLTWGWVRKVTLDIGKTKLKEAGASLVWLSEVLPAAQVEVRRWPGLDSWRHERAEPVSLRIYGAIPKLLDDAKAWESVLLAGPDSEQGIDDDLFSRLAAAAKRIHDLNAGKSVASAILAIPVAVHSNGGQRLGMTYMQAGCEHVLYTYGSAVQRERIRSQFVRMYRNKQYAQSQLEQPLEWRMVHTNEAFGIAHDAPVKNHVDGSTGVKWAGHEIKVNRSERPFFSHEKAAYKRGGPQLRQKHAELSLDRAFDQLTGRAPGALRAAFHAGKKERARSVGTWTWERDAPKGETPEQRTRRLKSARKAIFEEPYVHAYRAQLSPLLQAQPGGRVRANALFTRPLLASKSGKDD